MRFSNARGKKGGGSFRKNGAPEFLATTPSVETNARTIALLNRFAASKRRPEDVDVPTLRAPAAHYDPRRQRVVARGSQSEEVQASGRHQQGGLAGRDSYSGLFPPATGERGSSRGSRGSLRLDPSSLTREPLSGGAVLAGTGGGAGADVGSTPRLPAPGRKGAVARNSESAPFSQRFSGAAPGDPGAAAAAAAGGRGGGEGGGKELVTRPGEPAAPADGVFFAQYRGRPDGPLVVYRSAVERAANPERLNLDRRHLTACPVLKHEERVRLLNYQNNHIASVGNLKGLPSLIFLDLYNNSIEEVGEELAAVPTLRVLMLGKNRISRISALEPLAKLDVLDLHSNLISRIEGLSTLAELRVLNLAGNRLSVVEGLSRLASLTELNVRRNAITSVVPGELEPLKALQVGFEPRSPPT